MKTRTIIEHSTFRKMLSYKPLVTTKAGKQNIKNELKQDIINYYNDKYYRLKEATRSAVDFLCFTSAELGFSYASQEYLAKWGISERTIRRIMNDLQKAGIVFIAYRRKGTFNCCGKPVYFFMGHQYFDYWRSLLSIDDQSSNLVNSQVKNDRNVDITTIDKENQVSTSLLPVNQQKDSIEDRNEDNDLVPDYINHEFATLYKCYFGMDIKKINELWHIVKRQAWRVNIEPEHISDGAIHALKQAAGQTKIKSIKNFAAYFTSTIKNIYHEIFADELENMGANLSQPITFEIPYD